jgi:four helix bundle protein
MKVQSYRDLTVWQKAVALVVEVYSLTRQFPREELYGLTSQLRKAAVSVSSNIAEGSGRGTTKDLQNFLSMARGSVKEVESEILVSIRLGFVSDEQAKRALALTDEISRMLVRLRAALSRK